MDSWFCLPWFEQRWWQLWLSLCLWLKGTREWRACCQPLQLAAYHVFSGLSLVSCTEMWVWLQRVRGNDSVVWDNQEESIVRVRAGLCNRSMWVWARGLALTSYVTLSRSFKLSECLHLWGILVKGLVWVYADSKYSSPAWIWLIYWSFVGKYLLSQYFEQVIVPDMEGDVFTVIREGRA